MKIQISIFVITMMFSLSCTNESGKQEETTTLAIDPMTEKLRPDSELLDGLQDYLREIETDISQIPDERKEQLAAIAKFVSAKNASGEPSNLTFICTHNSRRSHLSQLWAQTAAHHFGIENVNCFSGGTEVTAFNSRSVRALRHAGFNIEQTDSTANPVYLVNYAKGIAPVKGFSKKYDDPFNPQDNFVAVMTCSHADESCPLVVGASLRIAIPYDDPKVADNTPAEEAKYKERCRQIATEMYYVFSQVKKVSA